MEFTRAEWRSKTIQKVAEAMCLSEGMAWDTIGLFLQNKYLRLATVAVDIVLQDAE